MADDLPEIANQKKKKNPWVLIIFAVVAVGVLAYAFIREHTTQSQVAVKEDYQIAKDNSASTANTTTTTTATAATLKAVIAQNHAIAKTMAKRLAAPMLVVQQNDSTPPATASKNESQDPNTAFMANLGNNDSVSATQIQHLSQVITEGSLIPATLESAINSDLPGYLRAIVSNPVYSANGHNILIPAGSRLIGQYKSQMQQGQARIFIVWQRLITPKGVSVNIASPGVDRLGVAGIDADHIDRHFWQQFGSAILLSIIGAGTSNVGVNDDDQYNAAQAYRIAVANSFNKSANDALKQNGNIPPTLRVNQGHRILVFVAHDLDFGQVMTNKVAVF